MLCGCGGGGCQCFMVCSALSPFHLSFFSLSSFFHPSSSLSFIFHLLFFVFHHLCYHFHLSYPDLQCLSAIFIVPLQIKLCFPLSFSFAFFAVLIVAGLDQSLLLSRHLWIALHSLDRALPWSPATLCFLCIQTFPWEPGWNTFDSCPKLPIIQSLARSLTRMFPYLPFAVPWVCF